MPCPGEHLDHGEPVGPHLELDQAVVEPAGAELLAELLPRGGPAGLGRHRLDAPETDRVPDPGAREQELEEPLLGGLRGATATTSAISLLTMLTASSMRSRIIDSTSRPT